MKIIASFGGQSVIARCALSSRLRSSFARARSSPRVARTIIPHTITLEGCDVLSVRISSMQLEPSVPSLCRRCRTHQQPKKVGRQPGAPTSEEEIRQTGCGGAVSTRGRSPRKSETLAYKVKSDDDTDEGKRRCVAELYPAFGPADGTADRRIRVAFVEDDDHFREAVSNELFDHGFDITPFADGASPPGPRTPRAPTMKSSCWTGTCPASWA